MAGDPKRVIAYVKADALARAVLAAGKSWPSQERGLYNFLRERSLRLPGIIMAGVAAGERREDAQRFFSEALIAACEAEYAAAAAVSTVAGDAVKKAHEASSEAREAIQDHLAAMNL